MRLDDKEIDLAIELDRPRPGEPMERQAERIADRLLGLEQQRLLSAEHYELVTNKRAFFRRYFIWRGRSWRFAFLRLKTKHGLSDAGLMLLYFTGNLQLRDGEVHVAVERWVATIGWISISLVSFVYAAEAISMLAEIPPSWTLAKLCSSAIGMAVGTAVVLHSMYVRPWTIGRDLSHKRIANVL